MHDLIHLFLCTETYFLQVVEFLMIFCFTEKYLYLIFQLYVVLTVNVQWKKRKKDEKTNMFPNSYRDSKQVPKAEINFFF